TVGGMTLPFPKAQDDLEVATGQLSLTKEFIDDPVIPGGMVILEFTIATLGAFDEASDLAFADDLDAALAGLAAVPPYDTGTCGGTLTGTSLLDFSGGSLTGGECSFSVDVTVPAPLPIGTTATNTTSSLTGTIDGLAVTGEPATDVLLVNSFNFIKEFDGPTAPGGTPVLTFVIENLSTTDSIVDLSFTDDLDAVFPGLEATGLPTEPCGVGSSVTGTSVLTLTGGNLLPGGSCTFSVDLSVPAGAVGGVFPNVTSDLEIFGVAVAPPATADLEIIAPPIFSKVFVPDMVGEGFDTTLTFTIANSSPSPVTALAFIDELPFDLLVAPVPAVVNTCGGMVTADPFDTTVQLTGGTVGAMASCTISVQVRAPSVGVFDNETADLISSSGNSGTATDTLEVIACAAADGSNLALTGVVLVSEFHEVCNTIEVQEHLLVLGPDGVLTLRAGVAIIFFNGVEIGAGGELDAGTDPSLIP
ncbi:MAG: hypothetical protein OES47_12790, partial [Acidobacteriota bacterium]|nr:hypothetical protein [Acidobacteriota bacterium]